MPVLSLNYAVIPHHERRAILLQANGDGWTLPTFANVDNNWQDFNVNRLSDVIREALGIDATVLRRALIYRERDLNRVRVVLLMENHTRDIEPIRGRWIGEGEIEAISDPFQHEAVLRWFTEPPTDPLLRTPWAKLGWFAHTRTWVEDSVRQAGYTITGPLIIKRTWSLTCMMVQPTDQGDLYIKATNKMFGPEAELTARLCEDFPGCIPEVIAYDAAERLYIAKDFGGAILDTVREIDLWKHTAVAYAKMQKSTIDRPDDFRAIGCWDRRPVALIPYIDALVSDPVPLFVGNTGKGITAEQFAQFSAMGPRLKSLCEEIGGLGIPATLTHGDFHSQNIAIADGKPIYFDWSDGSIAHPFMDLYSMLEYAPADLAEQMGSVREAYLAEWAGLASQEALARAFELATPLAMLNQAISYNYIYHQIEDSLKEEIGGGEGHYVKQLIKAMAE